MQRLLRGQRIGYALADGSHWWTWREPFPWTALDRELLGVGWRKKSGWERRHEVSSFEVYFDRKLRSEADLKGGVGIRGHFKNGTMRSAISVLTVRCYRHYCPHFMREKTEKLISHTTKFLKINKQLMLILHKTRIISSRLWHLLLKSENERLSVFVFLLNTMTRWNAKSHTWPYFYHALFIDLESVIKYGKVVVTF